MEVTKVFPKSIKADPKLQRISALIPSISPDGARVLVEVLAYSKRKESKLIIPGQDMILGINYVRAKVIAKGSKCTTDATVGEEVYFSPNAGREINYPNPDHTDKRYLILFDQSIEYFVKKK